jgi:hypothetical protein
MPAPADTPARAGDHRELSPRVVPPVAGAFLALADDGGWPEQRTPARVATALAAALLLACAAPLGWMARPHAKAPATPAALSARLPGAVDDD